MDAPGGAPLSSAAMYARRPFPDLSGEEAAAANALPPSLGQHSGAGAPLGGPPHLPGGGVAGPASMLPLHGPSGGSTRAGLWQPGSQHLHGGHGFLSGTPPLQEPAGGSRSVASQRAHLSFALPPPVLQDANGTGFGEGPSLQPMGMNMLPSGLAHPQARAVHAMQLAAPPSGHAAAPPLAMDRPMSAPPGTDTEQPPPLGDIPEGGLPLARSRSAASLADNDDFTDFAADVAALAASGSGRRRRLPPSPASRRVSPTLHAGHGPSFGDGRNGASAGDGLEDGVADGHSGVGPGRGRGAVAGGRGGGAGAASVGRGRGRGGSAAASARGGGRDGGGRGRAVGGGRGGSQSDLGSLAATVGNDEHGAAPSRGLPPAGAARGRGRGRRGAAATGAVSRPRTVAGTDASVLAGVMEAEANGAHTTQDRLLYALVLDMKAMRADGAAYRANTASVKVNSELAVGKVDECLQALMDMHRVHASVVLRLSALEEAMAAVVSNSASGSSVTAPAISAASPRVLRPVWALRQQVC